MPFSSPVPISLLEADLHPNMPLKVARIADLRISTLSPSGLLFSVERVPLSGIRTCFPCYIRNPFSTPNLGLCVGVENAVFGVQVALA